VGSRGLLGSLDSCQMPSPRGELLDWPAGVRPPFLSLGVLGRPGQVGYARQVVSGFDRCGEGLALRMLRSFRLSAPGPSVAILRAPP
jgi:hypothetical protein